LSVTGGMSCSVTVNSMSASNAGTGRSITGSALIRGSCSMFRCSPVSR
jgi:hypothetical protein